MKTSRLVVIALLAGLALAPLAGPATAASPVRLAVFGDTGTTGSTQANVDGAAREGATAYVGLGDYYYWSAPSAWKTMFRPLTAGGAYLALGNHDDKAAIAEYLPEGATWSRAVNGARLVAINTESRMDVGTAQYDEVRGALCGASEGTRILLMHKAWWLGAGARHPGTEFPGSASAMDRLVQECGVDLVLAGHEHNYQRLMRNGVPHLIVGTGGQSMYAVGGAPAGTVATYVGHGRLLLDLSADGFRAEFRSLDGAQRDAFSSGAAPAPAPTGASGATFSGSTGNEWWAQVKVAASGATVRNVEARDVDTAWTPLTYRSWGAWAGSLHVDPGSWVQYRATLSDGRVVTSCAYAHPAGACTTAAPATSGFTAAFRNVGGNEWWIQADVTPSGGTLAGVDARVNGGAWIPLAKKSWGAWAVSTHAPAGAKVELRARSTDGAYAPTATYAWLR